MQQVRKLKKHQSKRKGILRLQILLLSFQQPPEGCGTLLILPQGFSRGNSRLTHPGGLEGCGYGTEIPSRGFGKHLAGFGFTPLQFLVPGFSRGSGREGASPGQLSRQPHESHPRFSSEIPTLECANGVFYLSLLWGSKGRGGAPSQGFLHSQRGWRVGIFKVKPGASAIPGNISFF